MSIVPSVIGVIGGGRMGAGIAHVFARTGAQVTVIERDRTSAAAAAVRLEDGARKAAEHDATVDVATVTDRVKFSVDFGDLLAAELVVEAVPEVFGLKVQALQRAEQVVGKSAWLATNTSSLSVAALADQLARPTRLCGLHFFNPVAPSALVEIVLTETTDTRLHRDAQKWVTALGKTPIVVKDAPGFASSRLGAAMALEAMRMLEEGVASAEDIDAAMVLGYRHATGPLRTSDLVGLDIRLGIAEYLHEALGDRFEPPQILRDKVSAGELGRKSGRGFYDYT
jgi:3-hydroxybutyryl-CoA dehydrogenase